MLQGTCPTCHDFGPPGCLKTEPAEVHFVQTTEFHLVVGALVGSPTLADGSIPLPLQSLKKCIQADEAWSLLESIGCVMD